MSYKKWIAGEKTHPIGIGTWAMGGGISASTANDHQNIEAIRYSLDRGQNHIDTAQMYGNGHCEELVGEALVGYDRSNLFVATKVNRQNLKKTRFLDSVKESLDRLRMDHVDLLYIHHPWDDVPMKEYMEGMNTAVRKGYTRYPGVSNFNLLQLKRAAELSEEPLVANQIHYNLKERTLATSAMITYCSENEISIVAYSPVAKGQLTIGGTNTIIDDIASGHNATPAQISLAWLLMQENVIPIPKASNKKHIDENLDTLEIELTEDEMKSLEDIAS